MSKPSAPDVCVVGATGYVGGLAARRLASTLGPSRVVVAGRATDALRRFARNGFPVLRVDDLATPGDVARVASAAPVVINAAAVLGPVSLDQQRPLNAHLPVALRDEMVRVGGRRLIQLSSIEVYGDFDGRCVEEASPPRGRLGPYSQAKLEAESLLLSREHGTTDGLELAILRLGAVYGPASPYWVHRHVDRAARGQLRVIGRGDGIVFLVHEYDVSEAIDLSSSMPITFGSPLVWNIAHDEQVRWIDFFSCFPQGQAPIRRRSRAAAEVRAIAETLRGVPHPRRSIQVETRRGSLPARPFRRALGRPLVPMTLGLPRAICGLGVDGLYDSEEKKWLL